MEEFPRSGGEADDWIENSGLSSPTGVDRPSLCSRVGVLGGNWFQRLEDDLGFKRGDV